MGVTLHGPYIFTLGVMNRGVAATLVSVMAAPALISCGDDYRVVDSARLRAVVQSEFDRVSLPSSSMFVYQELEASGTCKYANLVKLFVSDRTPAQICQSFYASLSAAGWKSFAEWKCNVLTYPTSRAPIDGNRPTYQSVRLRAGYGPPPSNLIVEIDAKPNEAWGHLFMLSHLGEREAIPLAKETGKAFFTVKVHYFEDRALFAQHCPGTQARCDCVPPTSFSRKFADGKEQIRSN